MNWTQLGSTGVSTGGRIFGQILANRANRKMFEKQKAWSKEMWHLQNEYNTPEAQMQRMRDAGLNPALMYGQMEGGNAGPVGQPTAPDMKNTMQEFDPAGDYMRLKQASAGIENMEADTDLKRKEGIIKTITATGIEIQNETQLMELMRIVDTYDSNVAGDKARNAMSLIELSYKNKQVTYQDLKNNEQTIINQYLDMEKALQASKTYHDIQGTILANKMSKEEYDFYKKNGFLLGDKPLMSLFGEIIGDVANIPKGAMRKILDYLHELNEKMGREPEGKKKLK